eukprot:6741505-Prymnesium_polylepis.1
MGREQLLVVVVEICHASHDLRDDRLQSVGPSHASVPRLTRPISRFQGRICPPPAETAQAETAQTETAQAETTRGGSILSA